MIPDILKLIKEDKNALSDKEGQKPLLAVALQIGINISVEKNKEIENQLIGIELENLSIEEITAFLSFLYYSKIDPEPIIDNIIKTINYKFTKKDEDEIIKRGILLRFITEHSTQKLSLTFLLQEENVRSKIPWIWVDCVSKYNWGIAEDEIANLIGIEEDIKNLLIRLPQYIKNVDKNDLKNACVKWYANAKNSQQREQLKKWASNLNIKLGLSIAAEFYFTKISLFQKPVLSYE